MPRDQAFCGEQGRGIHHDEQGRRQRRRCPPGVPLLEEGSRSGEFLFNNNNIVSPNPYSVDSFLHVLLYESEPLLI